MKQNEVKETVRLKVLIVDDDADLGTFMKIKLSKEAPHFSMAYVGSGAQCLEYLESHEADCILSDYQMPGMDGMELLLALKEKGWDVPVIFVTGQGNEQVAREAFKNGASDYFTKEISFAHFTRIINSVEQAVQKRTVEAERRRAEDALRASRKYLQTIIDTEPECVKLLARDGSLIMMNRSGLAMVEADSFEQVKGAHLSGLVDPGYRDAFNSLGEKVFQGGSGMLEFELTGLKGRRLRMETHAVPLRDEKDEITALLGITRDITERDKAERLLRESQAELSAMIENVPIVMLLLDKDVRVRKSNVAAREFSVRTEEEITGLKAGAALRCIHSLDDPRGCGFSASCGSCSVRGTVLDTFENGVNHQGTEARIEIIREGRAEELVLLVSTSLVSISNEQLILVCVEDITRLKHTEEALKFKNVLFASQQEVSIDGIMVADENNEFITFNGRFAEMWNIPSDVMDTGSAERARQFVAPSLKDPDGFLARLASIYADRENKSMDTVELKDGRVFDRYSAPMHGEDGKYYGRVWYFRDITERNAVEQDLKKFKFIVDSAGEEFYLMDTSGNIVYANEAAAKSFGYTMDEMLRLNVADFNLEYAPVFQEYVGSLKERDLPPFETVHVTKSGTCVDKEVKAVCIRIGEEDFVCTFARDISERKVLERQRADFYAMVTHDLKSPLASILGFSELIAGSPKTDGNIIAMSESISRSGEKMLRLVEDFMAASRLESGGIELTTMREDVAGLLAELGRDFEPFAARKGITFSTGIPEDLPAAAVDRKYIERAVGNLLQNAFNYTRQGGEVKLRADAPDDSGGYLTVSVSDNGPGIPPEEREKIFDKYYRSPKTGGMRGTGLGLAIVKAVAEAHGGRVEVESEEGKGSKFSLYLPR